MQWKWPDFGSIRNWKLWKSATWEQGQFGWSIQSRNIRVFYILILGFHAMNSKVDEVKSTSKYIKTLDYKQVSRRSMIVVYEMVTTMYNWTLELHEASLQQHLIDNYPFCWMFSLKVKWGHRHHLKVSSNNCHTCFSYDDVLFLFRKR